MFWHDPTSVVPKIIQKPTVCELPLRLGNKPEYAGYDIDPRCAITQSHCGGPAGQSIPARAYAYAHNLIATYYNEIPCVKNEEFLNIIN